EDDEEVAEIHAAKRLPDGRHEDVVHQRGHDATEGGADDHTDGQVDGVATERELAKLLQHGVPPATRFGRWLKPVRGARRPVARALLGVKITEESAAQSGLHLLEGVEVLLETVDVLLHVDDGGPHLADGTE